MAVGVIEKVQMFRKPLRLLVAMDTDYSTFFALSQALFLSLLLISSTVVADEFDKCSRLFMNQKLVVGLRPWLLEKLEIPG